MPTEIPRRPPARKQSYTEYKVERDRAASKLQAAARGLIMRKRRAKGGFAAVVEAAMSAELESKSRAAKGASPRKRLASDDSYAAKGGLTSPEQPPQRRSWWGGKREAKREAKPPPASRPGTVFVGAPPRSPAAATPAPIEAVPQTPRVLTEKSSKADIKRAAKERALYEKKLAASKPAAPPTPLEEAVAAAVAAAAAAERCVAAVYAAVEAGDSARAAESAEAAAAAALRAAECAAAVAAEADAAIAHGAAPLVAKAVKSAVLKKRNSFNAGSAGGGPGSFSEGPLSSSFSMPRGWAAAAGARSVSPRASSSSSRAAPAVFRATTAASASERRKASDGSKQRGEAIRRTTELLGQRHRGMSGRGASFAGDEEFEGFGTRRTSGTGV